MKVQIDSSSASPLSIDIIDEYERQTKIRLPSSYKEFLLKHNGGHPVLDYIDLPPTHDEEPAEINYPAQLRYFYGLDTTEWFHDAWVTFNFFDTWIPSGILMLGTLNLECAELCFDFRKYPGTSLHSRFGRFLFGDELLDPTKECVPIKYFDWRYFRETQKFKENDLYPVASDFEDFISRLRTPTASELTWLHSQTPPPTEHEILGKRKELESSLLKSKNKPRDMNRPPRLELLHLNKRSD